jgi:chloride channel protein, CIC family
MGITRKRLIGVVRNEQTTLALLAIVIGLAASLGCIAFRYAIAGTQFVSWGMAGERLASHVAGLPWWIILLVPTLGGLAVGLLRRYVAADQRFHAVADVVEASALRGGRVSVRDGLVAAAGSALTLGVGGSAGREGPAVHLGAMLSSLLAHRFGLQRSATMTLLGCGVASAVATSFNAPIAGVFFALEVVVGRYGLTAFAPVVLASVVGTIVTRIHYGDFPAFIVQEHVLVSFWEIPAFALLGILSAGVAWTFMYGIFFVQDVVARWKVPIVAATMSGGLLVGLIALVLPEVLGVGYEATDLALHGSLGFALMVALVLGKIVATSITLGSGFGGGVFSPSLFVGAMLGGAFGMVAVSLGPETASPHTAYAIVGMAAVAGAVLGAPISTILIVFELTANFDLTIAVMIGAALASLLTNQVWGHSFFGWSLERRGIDLSGGRARQLLRTRSVASIMTSSYATLSPTDDLAAIRAALIRNPEGNFVVLDDDGALQGVVTMEDLKPWLLGERNDDDPPTAQDVCHGVVRTLTPGDNLKSALDAMNQSDDSIVPVLNNQGDAGIAGILTKSAMLMAHNRALADAAEDRD